MCGVEASRLAASRDVGGCANSICFGLSLIRFFQIEPLLKLSKNGQHYETR